MPAPPKEQHFKTNEFFRKLERSLPYRQYEKLVRKALQDQWQDVVLSGMINTIYKEYKNYFKRPNNQRVKVKKAEEDEPTVGSVQELREQEQQDLNQDKIIVPAEALAITALLVFLNTQVDSSLKSIASYYSFRSRSQQFIKKMANEGGQTVLDIIETTKPLSFRLSKQIYTRKIKDRVNTLIKGLDDTTKKRLVREIVRGIEKGERKSVMVRRLQRLGKDISKKRAKVIVATETQAITEYMRFETARMNGIRNKTWITAKDERVCPVCSPLHLQSVPMDQSFKSEGFSAPYPPAHIQCRCWLEYTADINGYLNFIKPFKQTSLQEEIDEELGELIHKAKNPNFDYQRSNEGVFWSIVNPNAVWAGGESLVGPDKNVGNLYEAIVSEPNYMDGVENALQSGTESLMRVDDPNYLPVIEAERLIQEARQTLTDIGFVQLLLRLGIRRKIPAKP